MEGPNAMNEQSNVGPDSATPAGKRPESARGTALKVGALALATLCLVIGAACWLHKVEKTDDTPPQGKGDDDPTAPFYGWQEPLFVVVLTAQEHGYLGPCGCSKPQYGGLERRYNFIKSLSLPRANGGRGWSVPVIAYDVGDISQKEGPAKLANVQGLIKYRVAMQARQLMGYRAVTFGEYEATLPLSAAIDEYALNNKEPAVLASNLNDKAKLFPDAGRKEPEWGNSYVGSWNITQVTPDVKVGALGIIGTHDPAAIADLIKKGKLPAGLDIPPSAGEQITGMDPKMKFTPAAAEIAAGVKAMAVRKPELQVLLYQGPVELAKLIPLADPDFNVILCQSKEDEPPGRPEIVTTPKGDTYVIRVGHKGKNLGVLGVYPPKTKGGRLELRYQLVPVGPEYETPPAMMNSHPVVRLLEDYTKELKGQNYLGKYGKIPHSTQATIKGTPALAALGVSGYAGSAACKDCHPTAFKVWAASDHHKAYATLVGAKYPSLREYDAECIVCHTVGFRFQGGFADATATPNLKDVGCESCHGPCEIHVKRPRNPAIHALINPYKAPAGETPPQKKKRELRIEGMCRECHDSDNDVTWKAFLAKWAKVEHPTPPGGEKRDEGE
jgi:hypothetical protein